MEFVKMQSTGNDFILFKGENNTEFIQSVNFVEGIKKLCNRHLGVGGDGLMFTEASKIADIKMNYYNSDGSLAALCGNGIRSFAKYVFDEKIIQKEEFDIETLAGIKRVKLLLSQNIKKNISVNLGQPIFYAEMIPMKSEKGQKKDEIIEKEIDINGHKTKIYILRVGVPHAVVFVDKIIDEDIETIGKQIEHNKLFLEKINVNFVKINNTENVDIFTWERGAGRTLSCGTGACASVVAGKKKKLLNDKVIVKTEGGELDVEINSKNEIFLTGESKTVFRGIIENRKL